MEKRIFLAIVISIALLIGWNVVAPKLFPELARKPVPKSGTTSTAPPASTGTTGTTAPAATTSGAVAASPTTTAGASSVPTLTGAAATPVAGTALQRTVVDTPEYRAVLSNRGAQLISFQLKHYKQKKTEQLVDLVKAREPHRTEYPFTIVPRDTNADLHRLNRALYAVSDTTDAKGQRVVEYRYSDGKVTATKRFTFSRQPFLFNFSVDVQPPVPYRIAVGPGIRTLGAEEQDSKVVRTGNGVVQTAGKFRIHAREKVPTLQLFPGVDYIGIEDNYFLITLRPSHAREGLLQNVSFYDAKTKVRRHDLYAALNATGEGVVAGEAFFGPKETKLLDAYNMGAALQFGWFGMIARFFLHALIWLNQFTHNYGFAIIVLTIMIKIALYPLQHKQNVSMKKMQRVQPKVEAIKAKYKKSRTDAEQRTKMNTEMMQLYQKEGINPMAGCLPLVLQLPILWGFYNLLSNAIELRGAPWILWIRDLSEKDPTYVLPILMTGTMFLQTYLMPATGDPAQRRMFLFMPLIFGFLFKDFPSGLVLYWLVQNILTIIQQLIMNKWWKDHPPEVQNG
ncbi:MAG: YidC/Oxa1 family rane protein insertase [Acidobacteriota bacterium]|jgi:YidC/Oxa1 family membrane protein insertase|nr:YidC/Oxa1 family rane protein insertase [Acidobacteriota bacterium]